jgi:cell wall-associated NlpC family hydrolase
VTPANGRVAHLSLRGQVEAERFVPGEPARVAVPLADILDAPGGRRQRQVLRGDRVLVLDRDAGFAFVQSARNGYCGYLSEAALGPDRQATHWVAAPATHLYPEASLKSREIAALSLGARLTVTGTEGRFARTDTGEFVPEMHLRRIGDWAADPVTVAESLMGTPYLWGGNSRWGIDCSGLVEAAMAACGRPCPGDSDLQAAGLGILIPDGEPLQRGDVVFWRGHAALVAGPDLIVHATGHAMAVIHEGLAAAMTRIETGGGGPPTARRRP